MTTNRKYLLMDSSEVKLIRSPGFNLNFRKSDGYTEVWGQTRDDDPEYSPYGPIIADIEIDTGCSVNCPWCYKSGANVPEKHMTLDTFRKVVDALGIQLTQIALGITTLCSNPDFFGILRYCRESGISVNLTTSGHGTITDNVLEALYYELGAIAVSVYPHNFDLAFGLARELQERGMKQVNFHLLYYQENLDHVYTVLDRAKDSNINALVLLAMKQKGGAVTDCTPTTQKQFNAIVDAAMNFDLPLGFDSCGAHKYTTFLDSLSDKYLFDKYAATKDKIKMMITPCESMRESIYCNVDAKIFPCSFAEGENNWERGLDILSCDSFLDDIWYHKRTVAWRKRLLANNFHCPLFTI